jgi:hypothetical protein
MEVADLDAPAAIERVVGKATPTDDPAIMMVQGA